MKNLPGISEAEFEVMEVLWKNGDLTSSQIIDLLTPNSEWKPKTIQTLITRLVAKNAVTAEKINGKAYIYSAAINENEYKKYARESFLEKMYNGSVHRMIASMVQDNKLSKKEIDELKKILE